MIRDLADDLLDSVGWSGGSQHSRDKEREGRSPNAQDRRGAAAARCSPLQHSSRFSCGRG
jgi:hypothetical protein